MAYHIYTTRALVLSYTPVREADRLYSLLTRDLGLIRAGALAVRKEASKLRGSLEPLTLATVSLVKGKEFWRITSAESIKRIEVKEELARPLALLEKLVQGESAHPELFDTIEEGINGGEGEVRLVANMLYHLGYLQKSDLDLDEKNLIKAINKGIEASNLS
jgi:DNA repair protein RecO (recombination protein O)